MLLVFRLGILRLSMSKYCQRITQLLWGLGFVQDVKLRDVICYNVFQGLGVLYQRSLALPLITHGA